MVSRLIRKDLENKILGPYLLSHHPFCDHFKDHVYHFGNVQVCRGCFCLYSGLLSFVLFSIVGAIFQVDFFLGWGDIERGLLVYALVIPTILTAFLPIPRPVKDFSRFLLGIAMGMAFITFIITSDLLFVRIWILGNYFAFFFPLSQYRNRMNELECVDCPDKDPVTGNCPGYKLYYERQNIFINQAMHGIQDAFAEENPDLEFQSPDEILKEKQKSS